MASPRRRRPACKLPVPRRQRSSRPHRLVLPPHPDSHRKRRLRKHRLRQPFQRPPVQCHPDRLPIRQPHRALPVVHADPRQQQPQLSIQTAPHLAPQRQPVGRHHLLQSQSQIPVAPVPRHENVPRRRPRILRRPARRTPPQRRRTNQRHHQRSGLRQMGPHGGKQQRHDRSPVAQCLRRQLLQKGPP